MFIQSFRIFLKKTLATHYFIPSAELNAPTHAELNSLWSSSGEHKISCKKLSGKNLLNIYSSLSDNDKIHSIFN